MGTNKSEANKSKPRLHSFLLAEQVYRDALTGKGVICGTYNQLWADDFPSKFERTTSAYMRLTDYAGMLKLYLRYVDLSNDDILLESSAISIKAEDRFAVQEVVMDVPPLPMPHAGQYAMDVYCNGEPIGNIRINVSVRPKG